MSFQSKGCSARLCEAPQNGEQTNTVDAEPLWLKVGRLATLCSIDEMPRSPCAAPATYWMGDVFKFLDLSKPLFHHL